MSVSRRVHEFSRLQTTFLRYHHSQEGIGGYIERHTQKGVGTALVELAGEFSVSNIELEKAMAGRQRHPVHLARIPGGDEHTPRVGMILYQGNDFGELVD